MKTITTQNSIRGQTMMEYIILVALLAVASIPVATILGNVFRDRVMSSADAMVEGTDFDSQGRDMVQQGNEKVRRSMSNFHKR